MHDRQLLQQYLEQRSQAAFAALVARHLKPVYSVCRREVRDASLAEDVTQVVFLILARKAATIPVHIPLSAWLFQTARFAARNALKQEARRRNYEQKVAIEMAHSQQQFPMPDEALRDRIEPLLNDALAALGQKEQAAILLRFYAEKTFREIGTELGISEDAAQKRVARGIEKLRRHLTRHSGTSVTAAGLIGLLSIEAVQDGPSAGLGQSILAAAQHVITGAAGSGAQSSRWGRRPNGGSKAMTLNQVSAVFGVVSVIVGSSVLVPLVASGYRQPVTGEFSKVPGVGGRGIAPRSTPITNGEERKFALTGPFTLRYSVVKQDVRTPEMRAVEMKFQRLSYQQAVAAGQMSQALADQALSEIEQVVGEPQQPRRFVITISADGDRLLYRRDEPGNTVTAMYDGQNSYAYETRTNHLEIWPHLQFGIMQNCPLPAVGLPYVSLLHPATQGLAPRSGTAQLKGEVPQLNATAMAGGAQYLPGKVELASSGQATKVVSAAVLPPRGGEVWDYPAHTRFKGQWIASQMRWTDYRVARDVQTDRAEIDRAPRQPAFVCRYQLEAASAVPPGPAQFDLTQLLNGRSHVQWHGGDTTVVFEYNPRGGSLLAQRDRQRQRQP